MVSRASRRILPLSIDTPEAEASGDVTGL